MTQLRKLMRKNSSVVTTLPTRSDLTYTRSRISHWDIHEIATFAGHRSIQTTTLYIHLSGRDLANKLARGMAEVHALRVAAMHEVLGC
jgi:integrase/recombinase XerD